MFVDVEARSLVNLLSLQPDDLQLHWDSYKENFSITFQNRTHELQKWEFILEFLIFQNGLNFLFYPEKIFLVNVWKTWTNIISNTIEAKWLTKRLSMSLPIRFLIFLHNITFFFMCNFYLLLNKICVIFLLKYLMCISYNLLAFSKFITAIIFIF